MSNHLLTSPGSEPHTFCWRPESIRPYESLWSVFRRLGQLNATTASGVSELLTTGAAIRRMEKPNHKPDLLRFGSIDRDRLSRFLSLQTSQVYEGSALAYLKEEEITSLASKWLRFCPKCLRADFHSPLHQFLFLKRCPGHNEDLVERCAVCKSDPVLYDMSSVGAQSLHEGNCCLRARKREGKPLVKKAEESFRRVASLLMQRAQMKTVDQPIERWLGPQHDAARNGRKLSQLLGYWQELLSSPAAPRENDTCYALTSGSAPPRRHMTITSNADRTDYGTDSYPGKAEALFLIYKSICRHLMRTHLRAHSGCIDCLMRRGWGDRSLVINRGKLCVPAHAFILWRMSWETARTPHELRTRHRGTTLKAALYWSARSSDLPILALYRTFVLECLAVFEECLLLAEQFHRKHTFSFNTAFVKQLRLPYWVIQILDDGSTVTHWWWHRSVGRPVPSVMSKARAVNRRSCCSELRNWTGFV